MSSQRSRLLTIFLAVLVLATPTRSQTGDDAACQELKGRMSTNELKVNKGTIKLMNGSFQNILNCVPVKTKVVVQIPEYHIQEKLTINKPVDITSTDERMLLGCDGMEISSDDVTVIGLKLEGCKRNKTTGLIHFEDAHNAVVANIECSGNSNGVGPACISASNSVATLHNVSATGNKSSKNAGFLAASKSNLALYNCKIEGNKGRYGGAISAENGNLHVEDSKIITNLATTSGAGIFAEALNVEVMNSNISYNSAFAGGGGGLYGKNWTLLVEDSTISYNQATSGGGGIWGEILRMQMVNSSLSHNSVYSSGGAGFHGQNGSLQVENSTISFNRARQLGGGIFATDMLVRVDNSDIASNSAQFGGGICGKVLTLVLEDSNISSNNAIVSGGGLNIQATTMSLKNSKILRNEARLGGGIYGEGVDALVMDSNISLNSATLEGGGIWSKGGNLHVEKSQFLSNKVSGGYGGGIYSHTIDVKVEDTEISLNTAQLDGGGVFGKSGSLQFENTNISSNQVTGSGGGICGEDVAITFKSSNISLNQAELDGGGINLQRINLHVESSSISSNTATGSGGGIHGERSIIVVISSHIHNNTASLGGGLHSRAAEAGSFLEANFTINMAEKGGGTYLGNVQAWSLENSWFTNNTAKVEGGAMSVSEAKSFVALNVTFTRNGAGNVTHEDNTRFPNSSGGALFLEGKRVDECSISHSTFMENSAGRGGAIWAEDIPLLSFVECKLHGNSALFGGAIDCKYIGGMTDSGSIFEGNSACDSGGAINLLGSKLDSRDDMEGHKRRSDKSSIRLDGSNFSGNDARLEGGAIDISGYSLVCDTCKIHSNSAGMFGGGLNVRSFSVVHLKDTDVSSCDSSVGAGISIKNAAVLGRRLSLTKNNASDVGGAVAAKFTSIFADEDDLLKCRKCLVSGNRAKRAGIFYVGSTGRIRMSNQDGYQVDLDLAAFSDNEVEGGNGPIMMFNTYIGARICCQEECRDDNDIQNSQCISQDNVEQKLVETFMKHVEVSPKEIYGYSSGEELNNITVTLVDEFGHPASVNATLTVMAEVEISGKPTIGVPITRESVVDGLILRAVPGRHDITVEIKSKEADKKRIKKFIVVEVRSCMVGERAVDGNKKCEPCPADSYNFGSNATCHDCLENAVCNGKTLVPMNGYWQSSSISDQLYRCMNDKACSYDGRIEILREQIQASFPTVVQWNGNYTLCSKGNTGRLCGSCEKGYGRHESGNCRKCPKRGDVRNSWKYLSVPASLGLLCLMVTMFLQSAYKYSRETLFRGELERTQTDGSSLPLIEDILAGSEFVAGSTIDPGDVLKILINFFQVTTTVTSIDHQWQDSVLMTLNVLDWLSGMTSESAYFTFTCFFKGNSRFLWATLVATFLPILVWFVFVGYSAIKLLFKRVTRKQFNTFCFVSAVAIIDISYLGWTEKVARICYCQDLHDGPEKTYWIEDTNIVCRGHPHMYLLFFVGMPLLIVVTLGFPLFVGLKLYLSRDKLHTENLVARYGYFYQGYHSRCAYWEVLIHLRKALIAVISVLSGGIFSELFASCLSLGVLVLAGALQTFVDPFKEDKLNTMEAMSLFTSSFIFILASMVYSTEGQEWAAKWLTGLLFGAPLAFVAYMGFEYLNAWKNNLHGWLTDQPEFGDYQGGVLPYMQVYIRVIYSRSKSKVDELGVKMRSMAVGQLTLGRSGDKRMSLFEEAGMTQKKTAEDAPLLD